MVEQTDEFPQTTEALSSRLEQSSDPAEKARLETELGILGPLQKYLDQLGLSQEQITMLQDFARRAGDLEYQEVKKEQEKGYVHHLDKVLQRLVDKYPENEKNLKKGSASIRWAIQDDKRKARHWVERFPDETPDEETAYRVFYFGTEKLGVASLNIHFVQDADLSLAQEALRELGSNGTIKPRYDNNKQKFNAENPDLSFDVFPRTNKTVDVYLKMAGDTAIEMVHTEAPPSPFED